MSNYTPYIILTVTIALSGLAAYYGFVRRIENRVTIVEQRVDNNQDVINSIAALNLRIEKVSGDNETFWKILGPHLAGIIHSPQHRERDELVDEFVNGRLHDPEEMSHLLDLLHEAYYSGRWTGDKMLAGALLLARVKMVLREEER
jgi:hypothetical protein